MNNMNFAATWKSILGLTAAGFVGTAVFVMIVLAISPLLLIVGVWLLIQKIRFDWMLHKARKNGTVSGYSVEHVSPTGNFSRHVEVTVVDESGKVL